MFDFITARRSRRERDIVQQMVSNVTRTLFELGTGFAFVGRQYHLAVVDTDSYIDLLFHNIKLRCYVVIGLRNDGFRPEFTGRLAFYVTAVDETLGGDYDNPTICLLLCKTKNDVLAEWSLRTIDAPIGVSEHRLGDVLPDDFAKYLPSPEDLQARTWYKPL